MIRGITTSYKVVDSLLLAWKNYLQRGMIGLLGIKETVKAVESNPADTSPVIVPKDELDLAKTEAESICRDPCEDEPDSIECKCEKLREIAWLDHERVNHIIERHWHDSLADNAGKFSSNIGIGGLNTIIFETIANGTISPNTRGRSGCIFTFTLDREIGTNIDGNASSSLRVVVSDSGRVLTAFPI